VRPEEVDADVVRTLAKVAGISLPDEDVEPLVGAFRNHLAGMQALDELDVDEFDPIVTFDPRWA
jgi:Asp-tRNA(Asn)/Glu-tRNA(Gln) amidotransferase C subunit